MGIAGTITPKPTATKKEATIKVCTSLGNSRQTSKETLFWVLANVNSIEI